MHIQDLAEFPRFVKVDGPHIVRSGVYRFGAVTTERDAEYDPVFIADRLLATLTDISAEDWQRAEGDFDYFDTVPAVPIEDHAPAVPIEDHDVAVPIENNDVAAKVILSRALEAKGGCSRKSALSTLLRLNGYSNICDAFFLRYFALSKNDMVSEKASEIGSFQDMWQLARTTPAVAEMLGSGLKQGLSEEKMKKQIQDHLNSCEVSVLPPILEWSQPQPHKRMRYAAADRKTHSEVRQHSFLSKLFGKHEHISHAKCSLSSMTSSPPSITTGGSSISLADEECPPLEHNPTPCVLPLEDVEGNSISPAKTPDNTAVVVSSSCQPFLRRLRCKSRPPVGYESLNAVKPPGKKEAVVIKKKLEILDRFEGMLGVYTGRETRLMREFPESITSVG